MDNYKVKLRARRAGKDSRQEQRFVTIRAKSELDASLRALMDYAGWEFVSAEKIG